MTDVLISAVEGIIEAIETITVRWLVAGVMPPNELADRRARCDRALEYLWSRHWR